ncbi:hypothetical protein MNBD_GAMMA05-1955 [hydrothermal vent metagenome]|uniref:Type 4 fimbrial biogenesis protein PilX N-terminal domain-containing protein n=1 Tax=hydrothermal vent metagenome TaxID=652676 RepID=A0A3B0XAS3_9ZZZZ
MNINKISYVNKLPVQKQQGFVLVLAIVLLTVLTLIGVSSMNSASIELKAASNAQQHQIAFNTVQSLIEYSISDAVAKTTSGGASPLLDYQTNSATTQTLDYTLDNAVDLQASLDYVDCINGAPGSSLEGGRGFGYNLYSITATGFNTKKTAFSEQVQGVRHVAASC